MTAIRLAISVFLLILVVLSVMGWVWSGTNQPAPLAAAARLVLLIGGLAGVGGLAAIWRRRSNHA
jgi:hypothetical protein